MRLDSGLYDGMAIPLYYDPLLAKLICWGEDRDGGDRPAAARARRIHHRGGAHDDPLRAVAARQPRFIAGDFSTDFIAEEWHPETEVASEDATVSPADEATTLGDEELAALVAVLALQDQDESASRLRHTGTENGVSDGSRWRTLGRRSAVGG